MVKKYCYFILLLIHLSACVKTADTAALPAPVISFYKGIDPWTHQPTFIYSDTTITYIKTYNARVNFAAAATLRHLLVKARNEVLLDKELENDNYYNQEFSFGINPDKIKGTFVYTFEALDWAGKTSTKTLTVVFK